MAAVVPALPVVAAFLWVDRWEPEPPRLLVAAFVWAAGISVLGAATLNDTARVFGDQVFGTGGDDPLETVVCAPVVEEAFKGAFLARLPECGHRTRVCLRPNAPRRDWSINPTVAR